MNDVDLSRDAIERVFGDWRGLPATRVLRHALGAYWLRQWGGRLWLTPRGDAASPFVREWDGRTAFDLDEGGRLSLLGIGDFEGLTEAMESVRVGTRAHARGGLKAHPRRPSKSLQQVFADLGIPPWRRDAVPLLLDGEGRVLAVGDLAYDAGFDAWLRERSARLLWQPGHLHGSVAARG